MPEREIVLDTETTGLDPTTGDRIVEIGCVELFNLIPTGESFHRYINPERDMPAEAFRVHGLSSEFLSDKPKFAAVVEEFLDFVGDAKLVIHNAEFDMKFINWELKQTRRETLGFDRVIDTLAIARRRHPGAPNSLDALCARYSIDTSRRTKHGALLDAEILAQVYLELAGGRQSALELAAQPVGKKTVLVNTDLLLSRGSPLAPLMTFDEREAHELLIAAMGEKAIWNKYN